MTDQLAHAVVLVPVVGALLAFMLGRSNAVAFTIASTFTLGALAAALVLVWQVATVPVEQQLSTIGPLPLGPALRAPMELRIWGPGILVAAVSLFVALCVQMFARWYLYSDPRYRAFCSSVALFTSAMTLLVLSNDVLLTLVGWEIMGWCSYLLIGHESNHPGPRRAALKAFLVTRIADAPFVMGLTMLAMGAHTTRLTGIVDTWSSAGSSPARTVALLGIICGVLGKSAQFPFTDWLPDAMEGPAPASALIHAATMVAAGTVVLVQLSQLLAGEPAARVVLVVLAGSSAAFAAFSAFCQPDIKRLLAWSTISQVGLMLVGVGVVAPGDSSDAALLQLVGHAFFKALLFLMIGWLAVVAGGTLASRMNGAVRRLPVTFVPVALGLVAMAGLPPTVAFVAKDLILESAAQSQAAGRLEGTIGFVAILVAIVGTAGYSARVWFILQHRTMLERRGEREVLTDSHTVRDVGIVEMLQSSPEVDEYGDELGEDEESEEEDALPSPGVTVRAALWTLALCSVFGGLLAFTPLLKIDTTHLSWALMGASVLLVVATGLVVRVMSLGQLFGDAGRRLPRHLPLAASRGFGMERVYVNLVARPVLAISRGVTSLDRGIDRGTGGLSGTVRRASDVLDRTHAGRPSTGLLWVIVGVVAASVLGVTLW